MKPTVYLETTIISYVTSRMSRDVVVAGRQQITRSWWDNEKQHYSLNISEFVLDECRGGDKDASRNRMELIRPFTVLKSSSEVSALAKRFISAKCVPHSAATDALHIAIAAVNNLTYLLTWNCTHIANATIRSHLALQANLAGYCLPVICTPEELLGGKHGIYK